MPSGSEGSLPCQHRSAGDSARHRGVDAGVSLQLCDTGAGAVLVLLRGAATDAAGPFDDAIADDRNCTLTHDHVAARGDGDAAWGRLIRALAHFAAGPAERRRGDGLALAAIST